MQTRWTGKNVDLDKLSECIEEGFFRDRGFSTERTESEGERAILWTPQRAINMRRAMMVKIVGDSNDFMIELKASELAGRSIQLGLLTKIFGGGHLAIRGLRLKEALEKLEREFWVFVEDKVAQLTGSAKKR